MNGALLGKPWRLFQERFLKDILLYGSHDACRYILTYT